ncbi:histidine kinase [Methylobacterium sp. V23]|uniref:sensor histidine kinase n=1 Tax=Methylobacterium sp. V23 TaxID=2044878 RepID=UPI000CDAC09C|nr:histidine kinase [Methylobacterium sp. V23]POR40170.1 hypothetical protein CRT23_25295 [Methylobacterium sp. V23]
MFAALAAAAVGRTELHKTFKEAEALLIVYAICSVVQLGFVFARRPGRLLLLAMHATDIIVVSLLLQLSNGTESEFFPLFIFVLTSSMIRWSWQGPLITSCVLIVIFCLLYKIDLASQLSVVSYTANADLSETLIRGSFIVICGFMFAYVAADRRTVQQKLEKLSELDSASSEAELEIDAATDMNASYVQQDPTRQFGHHPMRLAEIAEQLAGVFSAPRVLIVWDEFGGDERFVCQWSTSGFQLSAESSSLFGTLVSPAREKATFSAGAIGSNSEAILDWDLVKTFRIKKTLSAPIIGKFCKGRVFLLDRRVWADADIVLVRIATSRLARALDEQLIRDRLAATAAMHERHQVARDLHDTALQGLAAVSLQLKQLARGLPSEAQEEVETIRRIIVKETRYMRSLVEEVGTPARRSGGFVALRGTLLERVSALREQWKCDIALSVEPETLTTSFTIARHLERIVAEGVSNAVRHGHASRVDINIAEGPSLLTMRIQDNGLGFQNVRAAHGTDMVADEDAKPLSLRSRVRELGGKLFISSSEAGTDLSFELPK